MIIIDHHQIDTTLIAYSLSFFVVLTLIYWKMRKQLFLFLDDKEQEFKSTQETANYLKTVSVNAFNDEIKNQKNLDADLSEIKNQFDVAIQNLQTDHDNFIKNLEQEFENDLEEHTKQIHGRFIHEMKQEVSEAIIGRLEKRLADSPKQSPAKRFVKNVV